MHREILKVSDGLVVDHINHNGLDNRKANLRPASRLENSRNRRKQKTKTHSKYKGICRHKRINKWCAAITVCGKKVHIGYFDNQIDAAKAYDKAARKYYGDFAVTNFPLRKIRCESYNSKTLREMWVNNYVRMQMPRWVRFLRTIFCRLFAR